MPYTLTRFLEIPLPDAMPTDDLSTGKVPNGIVPSIGSVFNYFGSTQQFSQHHEINHSGKYVGGVVYRVTVDGNERVTVDGSYRVTAESRAADLNGKVDDLKAQIGKWGVLWRKRLPDGQMTWKSCRLLQVRNVETVADADVVSKVDSLFETMEVAWRSEDTVSHAVSVSAGVTNGLVIDNGGSLLVRDAVLTVACTSGTITSVTVTGVGIDLTWAGSIANGQTLTLDAGEQTVLIGTTDQYAGLTLNAGHTSDLWLPLTPGTNVLMVGVVGGNATVTMEHDDQWP